MLKSIRNPSSPWQATPEGLKGVDAYTFKDGRRIYLLGRRLVNLVAMMEHPAKSWICLCRFRVLAKISS